MSSEIAATLSVFSSLFFLCFYITGRHSIGLSSVGCRQNHSECDSNSNPLEIRTFSVTVCGSANWLNCIYIYIYIYTKASKCHLKFSSKTIIFVRLLYLC